MAIRVELTKGIFKRLFLKRSLRIGNLTIINKSSNSNRPILSPTPTPTINPTPTPTATSGGPPSGEIVTSATLGAGASLANQSPFSGGGYSYSFDNGFLSIPGNSNWALGTGDFTIEWFQYQTDNSPFPRIFAIGSYPSTSIGCSIEGGTFYAWFSGANGFGFVNVKNAWHHFAIVRRSGQLYVYKDGVQFGSSFSNLTNITDSSTTLYIGAENGGNSGTFFGGYITNIRLVKGLAVYTGDFTVPTSSLTASSSANPYGGNNTEAIPNGYTKLLLVPNESPVATPTPTATNAPNLVTSGLLMQLDAYETDSYPGTGTTVYDLANNYNHALIGATFTNLNGVKCFDCTTGNNRVAVNGTGPTLPTNGYTYITWTRLINNNSGFRTLLYTSAPRYTPITIQNGGSILGYWDNAFRSSGYDVSLFQEVWTQFTVVGDDASQIFYINGSQVGTAIAQGSGGNVHWGWGNNHTISQPWGHVANLYLYNRKLSLSEIQQQYNFLSPRFS